MKSVESCPIHGNLVIHFRALEMLLALGSQTQTNIVLLTF